MADFGFLLLTDLRKLKNHLLEIKRKPWKLLIYIFYIAWIIFLFYQVSTTQREGIEIPNLVLKQELASGVIKTLVILLFAYTLYSGSKDFGGMFSMGDVNFLFTSPLNPRIILAYSMLKQSLLAGLSGIFLIYIFPALQTLLGVMDAGLMLYSTVGIMILFVFTVPFSYLSFILATRFGLGDWIRYFLYGLFLFVLAAIAYGISTHGDVLQGVFWFFHHPIFPYIPIIGWSAELISVSFYGKTPATDILLVLQLLTIGLVYLLSILLATDYYEEAAPKAERMAKVRRLKAEGRNTFQVLRDTRGKKVRQVHVREVGQGPWAFLWMHLVVNRRTSGSLLLQWRTLAVLLLSIAGAILIPGGSPAVYYSIAGGIAYLTFIMSQTISLDGELKMKYIFTLPGRPWKKLVALNTIPAVKALIFIGCALVPIGIIWGVPLGGVLAAILFPLSMVILNLYSTVVIHILIPNRFDQKAFFPLLRILSFLLFLVPPGILGTLVSTMTNNIALAFYSIAAANGLLSGLCLWISDGVFGRLEVR